MSIEENKAIIQRCYDALSENKQEELDKLVASDYVFHGPGDHEIKGVEGLKKFTTWIHNMVPNVHFTIDDLIAEEDKVVSLYTMKGSDKRDKPITFQGIIISRVVNGKVVEDLEIFDRFAMASQIAPGWAKVILNIIEKQSEKGRP